MGSHTTRRIMVAGTTVAFRTITRRRSGRGIPATEDAMLWTLIVILVILWALGFGVFHVAGGLIHLLLVIAIILLIVRLATGRRPVA